MLERQRIYRIQGLPKKTHFLNYRFAKPGLRACGLPLPVGCLTGRGWWKATYLQTQFRKTAIQKVRFFWDTLYNHDNDCAIYANSWERVVEEGE